MKKLLILAVLVASGSPILAQKDAVLSAMAKNKIDESILDEKARDRPADFAYDLKETVTTEGQQKVILAHYDPTKSEDDRWNIISSDGQEPSTTEIKRFKKERAKPSTPPSKIDDASYKIENEDANNLVISYKPDPASLVSDNMFLKDCRVFLTIDKKSGKLVKTESSNEKPLKIKTFNVPTLNTISELEWNDTENKYFPKKDNITMTIKLLGQAATTTTILEYSNFKK